MWFTVQAVKPQQMATVKPAAGSFVDFGHRSSVTSVQWSYSKAWKFELQTLKLLIFVAKRADQATALFYAFCCRSSSSKLVIEKLTIEAHRWNSLSKLAASPLATPSVCYPNTLKNNCLICEEGRCLFGSKLIGRALDSQDLQPNYGYHRTKYG